MYRIQCGELWGGVRGNDIEACSKSVTASLFSSASDGGKGGDIYYFSVCNGDLLTRLAIADVLGHGQVVSDTSQWLYDALRGRMNDANGNEVLNELNLLAKQHGYDALTTAVLAAFYSQTGELMFSYAGHHPVMVRRRNSRQWAAIEIENSGDRANLPLGVDASSNYLQQSTPLGSGDQLFLYTDGVLETPDNDQNLFGMERLYETLNAADRNVHAIKHAVLESILMHSEGNLSHDDVTFVAVEIH